MVARPCADFPTAEDLDQKDVVLWHDTQWHRIPGKETDLGDSAKCQVPGAGTLPPL